MTSLEKWAPAASARTTADASTRPIFPAATLSRSPSTAWTVSVVPGVKATGEPVFGFIPTGRMTTTFSPGSNAGATCVPGSRWRINVTVRNIVYPLLISRPSGGAAGEQREQVRRRRKGGRRSHEGHLPKAGGPSWKRAQFPLPSEATMKPSGSGLISHPRKRMTSRMTKLRQNGPQFRPPTGRNVMGFLTRRVSWANWQFGPLKVAMLSLGIVVGAAFADFWKPYLWPLGLLFLVTNIWLTILWVCAMRRSP